jgi:hypothetical protein
MKDQLLEARKSVDHAHSAHVRRVDVDFINFGPSLWERQILSPPPVVWTWSYVVCRAKPEMDALEDGKLGQKDEWRFFNVEERDRPERRPGFRRKGDFAQKRVPVISHSRSGVNDAEEPQVRPFAYFLQESRNTVGMVTPDMEDQPSENGKDR